MRSSRDVGDIGGKLGPKLVSLVSQSVVATKRQLAPTEHRIRVKAMQDVIDRAGLEVGEHFSGIINAALNHPANANADPMLTDFLRDTASGEHQWKAISGALGIGQSLLGGTISNFVAPIAYQLNSAYPNTYPDMGTILNSVAQGFTSASNGDGILGQLGIIPSWRGPMLDMAHNVPDPNTLAEWVNRGLMTAEQAAGWYQRNQIPTQLIELYQALQTPLLTVADAALAVLRDDISLGQGRQIAGDNGYTNEQFDIIIGNTGEPPGPETLTAMYRRGIIDKATFKTGILQSRIRSEWFDDIYAARYDPPSTADVIQASIQGYMSKDDAKSYALQNGLEPDAFDPLWNTAGEPLSRTEMTDLVNRGEATEDQYRDALKQSRLKDSYVDLSVALIKRPMSIADAVEATVQNYISNDAAMDIMGMNGLREQDRKILIETAGDPLSLTEMMRLYNRGKVTKADVEQALRESRLKDKYIDTAFDLATALPGLYDIRLLVSEGVVDDATATKLLDELGYPDDLIKQLVKAFSASGSTASKTVTEGMLADLYQESAISSSEFTAALIALGYSQANAALILELQEWKIEISARNSLISHTRTAYLAGRITSQAAQTAMLAAMVPTSMVEKVMAEWELEKSQNIKLLSESQVVNAWNADLFSDGDPAANTSAALSYLGALGYNGSDASILLQLKNSDKFKGDTSGNTASSQANSSGA
jgi:hypothetical protein